MVSDPDGQFVIVQGQLHFYRMFRPSGRIERASDNAVLELNWHSLPDQFRLVLHRECDSAQQLQLRGFLLMNDAVFGRYFTVASEKKNPTRGS
jgi:hypothetical protein